VSKKEEMCNACKALVGADRHTPSHKKLILKSHQRMGSAMGSADETKYVCKDCGHEWLHETGSCGMGWL
jgi:transposase-like protein